MFSNSIVSIVSVCLKALISLGFQAGTIIVPFLFLCSRLLFHSDKLGT